MKGLTKRQSDIVNYVGEFIQTHRYSPSFREIMQHFGFSSLGTVYRHVQVLKRKGILMVEKGCGRSLSLASALNKEINSEVSLPFIGQIAAGTPIETFSQARTIAVPEFMVHAKDKTYVLRAMGDTLTEEMIADGDLLIVEARQEAHAGETVVALVNQHDTIVKRYFPEGQYIRLIGNNIHHHPILIRNEDIQIQGVLVGLLRLYG